LEIDSTEDLWNTHGATATAPTANVGTTAFVFKGAASLTVAATSIIVASLLF
jgi:hypothetical protein